MTLLDALLRRPTKALVTVPEQAVVPTVIEAKAVTGPGVTALTYSTPIWSLQQTPQKRAFQAAQVFTDHASVHKAETTVSGPAAMVSWHLENEQDDEITEGPAMVIHDLLEKPQAMLPPEQQQPGLQSRRAMWEITLRHMGVCGYSFWYLNETDALAGLPTAILYIAPWRLYTVLAPNGALRAWSLDKPFEDMTREERATNVLRREDVLPFYLFAPDHGYFASGLVQAAMTKIGLGPALDRHIAAVIGAGGRLTGLLSPKVGSVVGDDDWKEFVNNWRGITQDPNAAQRLQIVKGPVDYVKMAADLNELQVVDIDDAVDDDILEVWGVPRSQTGKQAPAGLNSGQTKGFDEAIVWQGPRMARLQVFYETVQYGLIDRWKRVGVTAELVLDVPKFDDDSPQWAKAVQAESVPIVADEMRSLVNLPPLEGEYAAFGKRVIWKGSVVDPAADGKPDPALLAPQGNAVPVPADQGPVKARVAPTKFAALRRNVDTNLVPKAVTAVKQVLAAQKGEIIRALRRVGLDALRKDPSLATLRQSDRVMADALKPVVREITGRVAKKTHAVLATGKAATVDEFAEAVAERVLTRGGSRITGINRTTRDAVAEAISDALADASTIDDVIRAVEDLDIFGESRAELIARTESMFAYNDAALGSYQEFGVELVEAIDGDGDPECAARDGQTYTLEEASSIEDHPNGTLDWVPVVPDEPTGKSTVTRTEFERDPITNQIKAIVETVMAA